MRTIGALAMVTLGACKPEPPWEGYLPTESRSVDCRALPDGETLLYLDPERPDELLGEALFTTDFGATWDRLYDGTYPTEVQNLLHGLGGGRWLEFDPDPTSRTGRLVTLPQGLVVPVTLDAMLGGPEGLRALQLADGTYAGVDVRGRVWTSLTGAFGSWVGRQGANQPVGLPRTVAHGERVWHVRLDGTVEASVDGGQTFSPRATPTFDSGEPLAVRDVTLGDDGRVLVAAYTWMWSSEDDGATWTIAEAHPEFVERAGVATVTAVGDEVYASAELNADAANPNPPGHYLLRTPDWGASWSVVRFEDGRDDLPYPSGGRVWRRPDGDLAAVTFRPSAGSSLCEASATPATHDDVVIAPERTLSPITVTAPADFSAWTDVVRVTGTADPGSTVIATLDGFQSTFRAGRLEADEVRATGTGTAGGDGQFTVDVAYADGLEPDLASTVGLQVHATDGYVSTPAVYRSLSRGGTPVEVLLEAPDYTTRTFDVRVTGTPDAALALYEGRWSGPTYDLRAIADAPTAIPTSGELTAPVTLTLPLGGVDVFAVASIPGSEGMAYQAVLIADPPASLLPPEVALVLFDVVTTGFYVNVRTAAYATFDWTLLDPSDAVLGSAVGVQGSGSSPVWVPLPIDYVEPASGTPLRLRVVQDVLGTRSPPAELALTQQ